MNTQEHTFRILFVARPQKNNKEESSIYARLTVNGHRTEFSLKTDVKTKHWSKAKERVTSTTIDARKTNFYLEGVRSELTNIYRNLLLNKKTPTPHIIKQLFFGNSEEDITLQYLIDYHAESQKDILTWGTLKNYLTTAKYLKSFLQKRKKRNDILLKELNYRFITEFEAFLRAHQPTDHQRPLTNNGIMKHMERFRKMINMAVKLEWLEKNPFDKYRLNFKKTERAFLTPQELQRLEEKHFSIDRIQFTKDLFVLACYTGLAYIDVHNLTRDNLVIGIDGGQWIYTKRQKTEMPVHIPLLPAAQAILEKYKDSPKAINQNKLFPGISNQRLNSYLKEIADLCNIKKNLSFHIARHTFATTIALSNGVPIETVSKILGHTKLSTTQVYAKVVENKISEDMLALKDKLNPKTNGKKHYGS
ncbi:site-specific integrase [Carboxylicivirga sediminis]|uniref:Site-specific integrase n=1 Tax=Carboxylicivirga sediminis TaxID=2006564 RepID=A0A941EYC6_9BACT|nr:site-specific integrase [Carboxylicivirga sediminis]MBR8534011.1 site-specific integrase [Carboxylicivirga sediminis]